MAFPTPTIFPGLARVGITPKKEEWFGKDPHRSQIVGHFVHLDDGRFHTAGKYSSKLEDVLESTRRKSSLFSTFF
jgi:hypothetical protein